MNDRTAPDIAADVTPYQRHMEALCRADRAVRDGDDVAARAAYAEAAEAMGTWVASLGDDKPRTRSVYAASLVALWYKAGEHEKARAFAASVHGASWLMRHSADRIRDVLAAMDDEGR